MNQLKYVLHNNGKLLTIKEGKIPRIKYNKRWRHLVANLCKIYDKSFKKERKEQKEIRKYTYIICLFRISDRPTNYILQAHW